MTPRSSQEWVDYFRWNGSVAMRVPWYIGADLYDAERDAIAHSIALFQLGEGAEGRRLLRYAREWAERAGDSAYPEAVRLLITEEQRHSWVLARFMAMNGIARVERGTTDGVFRWLRNILGSLEVSIAVLVTAEIIAKVYYPALRAATKSAVLQAICEQIEFEESGHVEFQTEQLARLRARRNGFWLWATAMLHRLLFYPTVLVVWLSHGTALRKGGVSFWHFFSTCRGQFLEAIASMDPRKKEPRFLKKYRPKETETQKLPEQRSGSIDPAFRRC